MLLFYFWVLNVLSLQDMGLLAEVEAWWLYFLG